MLNFWTSQGPREWPDDIVRRLSFIGRVFANSLYRQKAEQDAENQLRFEMLLSRLSTEFIHVQPCDLSSAMIDWLRRIGEFLGTDRGAIFELVPGTNTAARTQAWVRDGIEPTPLNISYHEFPWLAEKLEQGEILSFNSVDMLPEVASGEREYAEKYGIKSFVTIPLMVGSRFHGAISFNSSTKEVEWTPQLCQRLRVFGDIIANSISRQQAFQQIQETLEENQRLQEQLQAENYYLRQDTMLNPSFSRIIGESDALKYVLFRVQQVAKTDATVLILGETGTGKGVLAHAIHHASDRKNQPFITVNCAALPPNLIESELFGREKGAFTGSHARQLGRFEVAHRGTIFLDEIGDLPLDLQAKLLRVIQDGQFERLGSPHTVSVDVRVIAATSRDMREEIRQRRFREDLFYRLNVFPITLPPLRKRKEDIPLLVEEFVRRFARKNAKTVSSIAKADMSILQDYPWPGNVRELEGIIERMVITAQGPVLRLGETLQHAVLPEPAPQAWHLTAVEREHILKVLDNTGWRIEGRGGAADLLDLNPSTLRARMRKLGLNKIK